MHFSSLSAIFFLCFALLSRAQVSSGNWSVVGDTGVVCIHTALLPGPEPAGTRYKILCMERPHKGANPYPTNQKTGGASTTEVDVFSKEKPFTVTHVSRNPFCGGQVQMADGRIFSAGGDRSTVSLPNDENFIVDGRTSRRIYLPLDQIPAGSNQEPWILQPDMSVQRWYPTIITLPDSRQLIVSGSLDNLDLANMTLATKNPTYEYFPNNNEPRLALEILDRAHPWNLYPSVFLLPKTGKVFIFAGNESAVLDTATNTADETSIPPIGDPRTYEKIYPYTPTSALLPLTIKNNFTATVLLCGGTLISNISSPYCFKINPEDPGARWIEDDPMPVGKVMPDVVILPDGKLLYTNGAKWGFAGGDGGQAYNAHPPSYETFIYDPEAPAGQRYTNMTPATVGRLYHSSALLAPDGRVLTMGSEMANWKDIEDGRRDCFPFNFTQACTDPFETRVEAFEPPYFSVSNRISVDLTRVPRISTYGTYFEVFLTKGFESRYVTKANFIRYGSGTHSTNSDQRLVEALILSQNPTTGRLVIEVPSNANALPPGNYMLWLLDDKGIPSVNSVTILVNAGPADKTTVKPDPKWDPTATNSTIKPTGASTSRSDTSVFGKTNMLLMVAGLVIFLITA